MRFALCGLLLILAVPAVAQTPGFGMIDTGAKNGAVHLAPRVKTVPLLGRLRRCSSALEAVMMEGRNNPTCKGYSLPPAHKGLGCIDTGFGCGERWGDDHGRGKWFGSFDLRATKSAGKTEDNPIVMQPMSINAPAPTTAVQPALPPKPICDYRGVYTGTDGKLFSRYAMRAQEELELDRCTAERRLQHDKDMEAYNAKMSVWVPCETDAKKIARANFQTDEQATWQVFNKCGVRPELPREPEACTNFWSGFETASQYDPRWIYLRHLEIWEICLHKQVGKATVRCTQGDPGTLERVDEQIEKQCGSQPARPVIDGKTPSSVQP